MLENFAALLKHFRRTNRGVFTLIAFFSFGFWHMLLWSFRSLSYIFLLQVAQYRASKNMHVSKWIRTESKHWSLKDRAHQDVRYWVSGRSFQTPLFFKTGLMHHTGQKIKRGNDWDLTNASFVNSWLYLYLSFPAPTPTSTDLPNRGFVFIFPRRAALKIFAANMFWYTQITEMLFFLNRC